MDKLIEIKNTGTKEFQCYQVLLGEEEFCLTNDIKKANKIKSMLTALESKSVDQPGTAGVEKKLLDLFGFIDGGVDAENQVKIFKFMDWYKSRSVASDPQPANVREILINYSEFLWGKGAHIGRNFFDSKALSSEKAVDEFLSRSK